MDLLHQGPLDNINTAVRLENGSGDPEITFPGVTADLPKKDKLKIVFF